MFDFPFSFPTDNKYRELGLAPDSTADDIREAKGLVQAKLRAKKAIVNKALNSVYAQVPGLREASKQDQNHQKTDDNFQREVSKEANAKFSTLLPKALAINPDFRRLQKELEELDQRIRDINLIILDNPEKRLDYDRQNPPLGLLRFSDASQDDFVESKTALFLLRRELGDFFLNEGEVVFHPSDMTRKDFSADYTPNKELDEESHG